MIYEEYAERLHYYNFVFYEVEKDVMYIYCPNCGCEHRFVLDSKKNVTWIKKNYMPPCGCFVSNPVYKHSRFEHSKLNNLVSVAEFARKEDGDIVLNAYWHTARFAASNYDTFGYAFKRYPVFDENKVLEITYSQDGTVTYNSSLYIPMCSYNVHIGQWRKCKNWRKCFQFNIIKESFAELKGTFLEKYIADVEKFENIVNLSNEETVDEMFAAWLVIMQTKEYLNKLWKAGYYRMVYDRMMQMFDSNYNGSFDMRTINPRGKTVRAILKIEPSKFDLIEKRANATTHTLSAAQKLDKLRAIKMSPENIAIVSAYRFDSLCELFGKSGCNLTAMFKYIRHHVKKESYTTFNIVCDYYDYLHDLEFINTPLTKDVVFPTNFKSAHNKVALIVKQLQVSEKEQMFKKKVSRYSNLNYADNLLNISVVKSAKQLVREASKMHNCAAGYIDRIIRGESVIFLIRQIEHPRKPYCMLELQPSSMRVVQNRAIYNKEAPYEAKCFVTKWLQYISKSDLCAKSVGGL